MNDEILNQYTKELKVLYRDECYLVRDNGAICRQPRTDKRVRRYDDKWTFGIKKTNGYRYIGNHPVHQVIATAFHGTPPSENHVIDHIDTNRENNRPENLRWVTRAENLFNNPITRERIESIWGSVESMLGYFKSVSPDINSESLTPMATQRSWRTPCEFPACPEIPDILLDEDSYQIIDICGLLEEYKKELEFGTAFSQNIYGESLTVTTDITSSTESGDIPALIVLCNLPNNTIKSWAVARVTFENKKFVHENMSSFFTLQGALKAYCQIAGISFENSFDDYC